MKQYQTFVLLMGLLGLHGSFASAQPRSPAELYQLFEKLKSSNLEVKNQASQELHAYAQWWLEQDVATMRESLPAALEGLDEPNPAVRRQASAFFGVVTALRCDDISEILSGTVDEIISHFEDPNDRVRGNMIRALALWSPAPPARAIVPFMKALEDPSGEVRSLAVYGLVRAAPESDSVAQAIANALDSLGPEARRELTQSLENARADHPIIVQKLIEQLDDDHRPLVYTTAKALGVLGSEASDAVPRLRMIAEDPDIDDQLREVVNSALRSIQQAKRRP